MHALLTHPVVDRLFSLCSRPQGRIWTGLLLVLALLGTPTPASAQAPLSLVNEETTVSEISFRFVEGQSFEAERLQQQMATEAPSFVDQLRSWFAFLPTLRAPAFPFDPVTLQKDVVRLRRFYQQNGFPAPSIDYPASQLDTTRNAIHIILSVQEGDPIVIRNIAFQGPEGAPVTNQFSPSLRRSWTDFLQRTAPATGERYTTFRQGQIESDVRTWLRDQGYAFASVSSTAEIDSSALTADLQFNVNPGPVAYVSDVQIQGTESVAPSVALRELSFGVGDRFSASEVTSGQRQLFDLNLFRVALADVPEQSADSTVVVRYRVREANLRSYSGQVGYGTQSGVTMEGSWRHRNFYGDARTLIVGLIADTGYPERPPGFVPNFLAGAPNQDPSRRFRASATLRQPYVFSSQLSASVEPFVQERLNSKLSTAPLDRLGLALNERQYGVNTQLVYDFLPFRTLSLQHSFSRTRQFGTQESPSDDPSLIGSEDDLFDRSVFSVSGTFGKADDFINPTRGFIIRPAMEVGGALFESGVEFVRLNSGVSGYLPLTDNIELAARLSGGVVLPFGESRTNLTVPTSAPRNALESNRTYQNRFSDYLFYAGGGSDIRGWTSQLAGGKVLRRSDVAGTDFVYEAIGGRSKVGVNLELRLPFPGLGSAWRTSVFLDGASLNPGPLSLLPPPSVSPNVVTDSDDELIASDPSRLLVGTGVGLRYKTPFGFLRLDLAYKLTPDYLDLRRPGEVGCAVVTPDPQDACAGDRSARSVPARPIRRFRLHFGIGRSF